MFFLTGIKYLNFKGICIFNGSRISRMIGELCSKFFLCEHCILTSGTSGLFSGVKFTMQVSSVKVVVHVFLCSCVVKAGFTLLSVTFSVIGCQLAECCLVGCS